jgi:rfaE bifunctional protein nucleotidyltransferase chain/domain
MKYTKVFVNGSFDLLHPGHIRLLNTARSMGDYLMVAIDSDRRISEKKGLDRPVNNQSIRYAIMSNIKSVDQVKVFDSDAELEDIIKNYQPDIMMVGSDWRNRAVIGSQYAGRLEFFERQDDYSTTSTLQNYINRR